MPKREDIKSILIIGSGPIVIGQACEFDYSGTQACKVLRKLGYKVILVNSNPATIMTDPELADVTYIEPLTPEFVAKIIEAEKPDAGPAVKVEFSKGDAVKIKEGPFENFEGTVDEIFPDKGVVRVIVTIFGRATPLELEYWQLEKVQ